MKSLCFLWGTQCGRFSRQGIFSKDMIILKIAQERSSENLNRHPFGWTIDRTDGIIPELTIF